MEINWGVHMKEERRLSCTHKMELQARWEKQDGRLLFLSHSYHKEGFIMQLNFAFHHIYVIIMFMDLVTFISFYYNYTYLRIPFAMTLIEIVP
jgi:hypothetical protein